jgi:hypothetical protein
VGSAIGVIRDLQWQTRRSHVTVADRFNLFQATMLGNLVKARKEIVQHANQDLRAH